MLARRTGVVFVDGPFETAAFADLERACDRGYVRLGANPFGAEWLFAPRGEGIARLIGAVRAQRRKMRFAVTTPRNFSARLHRRELASAALAAPCKVEAVDPKLCAQHAISRRRLAKVFAGSALALAPLFQSDRALALIVALPLAVLFFGHVLLRLYASAAALETQEKRCRIDDAALPPYTVIVALYREARVARQLAEALDRLDYPRAKLQILFVVEADDQETAEALREHPPRSPHEILVAPPGLPKTKPRALNIAAPFVEGELLAVFDAEDKPHPRQLRDAAAKFARSPESVACLQASLAIENGEDNLFTAFFALDYAALFDAFNPGLCAFGLPIFLGGTSNHFRVAILKKIGFWDAWNVTEDADLGLRLARHGYQVQTLASHTFEEAPVTLKALVNQRSRWMKGWMQTALTHLRDPRQLRADLGLARTLATLVMFVGGFLGPLLGPLLAAIFAWRAAFGEMLAPKTLVDAAFSTLWCSLALSGLASAFWPMYLGMRRRKLERLWPAFFIAPLWQAMLTLAAWRALIELWKNPYLWRKTEHGLSRRDRSARARPPARSTIAR